MGNGLQFVDIIFFAVIAAFLVARLWGVLGRRDGHEGDYRDIFKPDQDNDAGFGKEDKANDDNVVPLREDDAPVTETSAAPDGAPSAASSGPLAGIAQIQEIDPGFVPSEFLSGARIAFEMILDAFASGDTATLKPLLSADVFANFQSAIRDREAAGEKLEETLVGFKLVDIEEAWTETMVAYVTVRFVSEQISAVRDENGDVVEGNPTKVIEITDLWTFSRTIRSRDPNWILVETKSLD